MRTSHDQPPLSLDRIRVCIVVEKQLSVLNFSQCGMAIQTIHPLTMGRLYSFQINHDSSFVSLEGEVVRCNLSEVAECTDGAQETHYLNGINFHIERNPLELSLLDILHEQTLGEKRRFPRVRPKQQLFVDVGRACFSAVKELTPTSLLVESRELIDLDQTWPLMIQIDGRSITVNARILHVSKKTDASTYAIQMEFVGVEEAHTNFLREATARLARGGQ